MYAPEGKLVSDSAGGATIRVWSGSDAGTASAPGFDGVLRPE